MANRGDESAEQPASVGEAGPAGVAPFTAHARRHVVTIRRRGPHPGRPAGQDRYRLLRRYLDYSISPDFVPGERFGMFCHSDVRGVVNTLFMYH